MYKEITKCRICNNTDLIHLIDLGIMSLTGIFPKTKNEKVGRGPLILVKCNESNGNNCGLVQLKHNYDFNKLYGDNYGYRSGLNKSMISHLNQKVNKILSIVLLEKGDIILDIGSNDGTLLKAYPKQDINLIGIDPTGKKFEKYYSSHIKLIPDFFSAKLFQNEYGKKKAKIVTSIAMFYDLENPLQFVQEIHDILDTNGVWIFEQSYLPTMIDMISYDTICHEHLEYYTLKQIKYITDKIGMKIIDVEFNNVNGGSFSVMVSKNESNYEENTSLVNKIIQQEVGRGFSNIELYKKFENTVKEHKNELHNFFMHAEKEGKKIYGYGASTKGNVLIQYCNLTEKNITAIGEVNEEKFGRFTPGSLIPIKNEEEIKKINPDYILVLPWHFKDSILKKEKDFLKNSNTKFVFPLPKLEVIG